MSETETAAAGTQDLRDSEQIDLTDQDSQSTVGCKRQGGRLEGDAWEFLPKIVILLLAKATEIG